MIDALSHDFELFSEKVLEKLDSIERSLKVTNSNFVTLTLDLPISLVERIEYLAEIECISISDLIRRILLELIQKERSKMETEKQEKSYQIPSIIFEYWMNVLSPSQFMVLMSFFIDEIQHYEDVSFHTGIMDVNKELSGLLEMELIKSDLKGRYKLNLAAFEENQGEK